MFVGITIHCIIRLLSPICEQAVYSLVVLIAEPLAAVFVKLIHLLTSNSSRSLKIIRDAFCEKVPIVTLCKTS